MSKVEFPRKQKPSDNLHSWHASTSVFHLNQNTIKHQHGRHAGGHTLLINNSTHLLMLTPSAVPQAAAVLLISM